MSNELARTYLRTGPEDKVYQVVKLARVIDALAVEGISVENALAGVRISRNATSSPATRVSLNQIIECYRNANKLTRDPILPITQVCDSTSPTMGCTVSR